MTGLEVEHLGTGYGTTQVVTDVSLSVEPGQIVAIFGRNGVGKTTLLRGIMGYLPLSCGRVLLDGEPISGKRTHVIVRAGVGYAAQERSIFSDLTVETNLKLARQGGDNREEEAMLNCFPRIRERMTQKAGTLSGGEQKMLIAVRTLANASRVAILDEIVEGVQPGLLGMFQEAVRRASSRGLSILLVEQHLNYALPLAHDFIVMSSGRVVEAGPVTGSSREQIERHLVL
ncbi:MAG: ATP-binding cassette domain-containing protein [Candidatus Nanopelagicales bacterium]|nr:ATP-binding cassette domain-containing protein [Candidatus Nanopelagicales bacterium]